MPNADWYTKNRADILGLIPSVLDYMSDNDELFQQDQDQMVQSVVDMAAAIIAELDQRGIGYEPKPRCTIPEEDYAD